MWTVEAGCDPNYINQAVPHVRPDGDVVYMDAAGDTSVSFDDYSVFPTVITKIEREVSAQIGWLPASEGLVINNLIEPDDNLLGAPEHYFSINVEAQGPLNVQITYHTYESGSLVSIDTVNRCVYLR